MKSARRLCHLALAMSLGLGAFTATAGIAPGEPEGDSMLVLDTNSGLVQVAAFRTAMDADGDAIVAWAAKSDDETQKEGVYIRRITAGEIGEPETLVERTSGPDATYTSLAVAMDADGDALVAWLEETDDTHRVMAQWVPAQGEPAGEPVEILSSDAATTPIHTVGAAMDANGNAAVAWSEDDSDIYFHRFAANGNRLSDDAEAVREVGGFDSSNFTVSAGASGHLVFAWRDAGNTLVARAYSPITGTVTASDAITLSERFNPETTKGRPFSVRIAVDADGNFAIAWVESEFAISIDPPISMIKGGVYAQRFDATGTALLGSPVSVFDVDETFPFPLPEGTTLALGLPIGISMDAEGNIVVDWMKVESSQTVDPDRPEAVGSSMRSVVTSAGVAVADDTGPDSVSCIDSGCVLVTLARDADDDLISVNAAIDEDLGFITGLHAQRYRGPESADISVSLGASAAEAKAGDTITLSMAIENMHPISDRYGNTTLDQAVGTASGISVNLDLPFALPEDTGEWTCEEDGESMRCTHPGTLYAGDKLTLEAAHEITADDVGEHEIVVTVSADRIDPDTANNTAKVSLTVSGDDGDNTPPPAGGGGGGGGALGWLALLLVPLVRRFRSA